MFITNIDDLRTKMNEAGKTATPFLFGLNFEMTEGFFIENPKTQDEIQFQLQGVGNKLNKAVFSDGYMQNMPMEKDVYAKKFDLVQKGLHTGDSFLANLTVKTPIEINLTLDEIFAKSNSPYQLYIPNRFVCFSPERFVKITKSGLISTNPMKGTIDAKLPNAENVILNDYKETAEHCTIVDLMRNDIGMVADEVEVKRFRYIDRIDTNERSILQVSSEIVGQLPSDFTSRLGDIILELLPAGSISGAPKLSTLRMIHEAEQEDRGYYTGIFGYFDGEELDSAVLIRYIEQEGDQFYFRSGGGITVNSDCADEYEEVLSKIYLPFI